MSSIAPTERTRVGRLPKRGVYDRDVINQILDEAFVCHVGFVVDGQPFVIPTGFGRDGDTLYIHGSAASRMVKHVSSGIPVCVTVTLVDGLVLARSVFHHSMNYRSVVLLGTAELVTDPEEKLRALAIVTDHIAPGRWAECRQPLEHELKATSVLRLPMKECSAKIRSGPPIDDEEDYRLPVWAGAVPLALMPGTPIPDARLSPDVPASTDPKKYAERLSAARRTE